MLSLPIVVSFANVYRVSWVLGEDYLNALTILCIPYSLQAPSHSLHLPVLPEFHQLAVSNRNPPQYLRCLSLLPIQSRCVVKLSAISLRCGETPSLKPFINISYRRKTKDSVHTYLGWWDGCTSCIFCTNLYMLFNIQIG